MELTPARQGSVDVVVVESSVVELVEVTVVEVSVVDVTVVDVTVDDVTVVLVPPPQGQSSGKTMPTVTLRQSSASVALIGNVPVGAQMHSGEQVTVCTAACRM